MRNSETCWKCGKAWRGDLPILLNVYSMNPKGPECKSLYQCAIRADERRGNEEGWKRINHQDD